MDVDVESLTTHDMDGDGDDEVLVGGSGAIWIHDGLPATLSQSFPIGNVEISHLEVADIDQDGGLEVVFARGGSIWTLDPSTGSTSFVNGNFLQIHDLHIGNIDDDPALEIAYAGLGQYSPPSYTSRIVDGATFDTQPITGINVGFDDRVRLGDIDGDSRDEIVGVNDWDVIWVMDWTGGSPLSTVQLYELSTDHNVGTLELADWDADGQLEIVYSDAQWGSIWIHDGATGALEREVENPVYGTGRLTVGDADQKLFEVISVDGSDALLEEITGRRHRCELDTALDRIEPGDYLRATRSDNSVTLVRVYPPEIKELLRTIGSTPGA